MEYVRVGTSGLKVSRIGLGMMSYGDPAASPWFLPEEAAEPIVRRAVEGGVTFFDTADMYSGGVSEEITGSLLRRLFDRREDYVLATKVGYPMGKGVNDRGLSRKHILDSIDASLRRLGTDHVDLYQIHRWDDETPVEETMRALDDVVRAGKARYIGASLMYGWQLAKAQHVAKAAGLTRFVAMQTRYNLAYREEEREVLPYCADQGLGVLPYSPLARGLLAGGEGRATTRAAHEDRAPENDGVVAALRAVAGERGVPPARVALAWLLGKKPGNGTAVGHAASAVAAPIVGATRPGHLDDALAAVDLVLTADEVARLEAPYRPREPFGYGW
ncbi:aldo/keto reductase [Nonomuraea sp. NPDC049028]|uniref:aldo/keto reductase n=1 Tax=Nonomuraea sp. NPDC049028 TaxID=3364348 RepID=UPI003712DAFC